MHAYLHPREYVCNIRARVLRTTAHIHMCMYRRNRPLRVCVCVGVCTLDISSRVHARRLRSRASCCVTRFTKSRHARHSRVLLFAESQPSAQRSGVELVKIPHAHPATRTGDLWPLAGQRSDQLRGCLPGAVGLRIAPLWFCLLYRLSMVAFFFLLGYAGCCGVGLPWTAVAHADCCSPSWHSEQLGQETPKETKNNISLLPSLIRFPLTLSLSI